jgi:hypothetical protein
MEGGTGDPTAADPPPAHGRSEGCGALRRRTWGWSVFRKASPVRASLIAIGTIAIVAGVVLISAGLNIITITRMSGNTTWAIVGTIVAVVGMLVLLFAIRRSDVD